MSAEERQAEEELKKKFGKLPNKKSLLERQMRGDSGPGGRKCVLCPVRKRNRCTCTAAPSYLTLPWRLSLSRAAGTLTLLIGSLSLRPRHPLLRSQLHQRAAAAVWHHQHLQQCQSPKSLRPLCIEPPTSASLLTNGAAAMASSVATTRHVIYVATVGGNTRGLECLTGPRLGDGG